MSEWKKYLASIYYDVNHPGSYAGPDKLYLAVKSEGKFKIGKYRIRKWLQDQESYSLTRGARRKFPRNRVIVDGVDSQWDIDLADMSQISKENDSYKYVLVAIDIFSRYVWCQPLKTKEAVEVVKALTRILNQGRRPKVIRSDKGRELRNKKVFDYLKTIGVHHFVTQNDPKANYVERVIKTLKHKLFRYLMKKRTKRYIDVLDDVVRSYNSTVHRSLGRSPSSVNKETENENRLEQYLLRTHKGKTHPEHTKSKQKLTKTHKGDSNQTQTKIKLKNRYKYKIGQVVRISHVRGIFDREYSQKWTGELFKVKTRYKREDIPVYTLKDWSGEEIEGTFYASELQSVNVDDTTEYFIEQILQKRTRKKRKEVLVRWAHWPKKYDSWIPEKDVKQYS